MSPPFESLSAPGTPAIALVSTTPRRVQHPGGEARNRGYVVVVGCAGDPKHAVLFGQLCQRIRMNTW